MKLSKSRVNNDFPKSTNNRSPYEFIPNSQRQNVTTALSSLDWDTILSGDNPEFCRSKFIKSVKDVISTHSSRGRYKRKKVPLAMAE